MVNFGSNILFVIFVVCLRTETVFGDDNVTDSKIENSTLLEENRNQTEDRILIEPKPKIELQQLNATNTSKLEISTFKIALSSLESERDSLRQENEKLRSQLLDWAKDKEAYQRFMTKNVMTDPVVKLYSGQNFTGNTEEYDFGAADRAGVTCQNQWYWRFKLKSVETSGKCLRLFRYPSCMGWSLAIYPGSGNSHNVLTFDLREVQSIGRCVEYELQHYDTKMQTFGKNSSDPKNIPDLVEFYGWSKYLTETPVLNSTGSLLGYKLGPKGRLEFVRAWISPRHLNMSQRIGNLEESEFYLGLEKKLDDILGFAIPSTIGGPSDQTYNIFPQTVSGQIEWLPLVSRIHQFVKQYENPVQLSLNFQFDDNITTRPNSFYYYIEYRYGSFKHKYGRILN